MALTLENPEIDRLAQELAAKTGESLEAAILNAVRERIARQSKFELIKFPTNDGSAIRALEEFRQSLAELPILDDRSADEILGYDEWGLPH